MTLADRLLGTRRSIAGTIYGTIVVLASITAGAAGYEDEPWRLGALVTGTVLVFWIAHVYAHGIGESLTIGRRITTAELRHIAHREASIVLASVVPVAVLFLGALGVFRERSAIWIAFGIGVATLAAQGLRYARLEHLSRAGAIATVSVNLALGLVIVVLKVMVAH